MNRREALARLGTLMAVGGFGLQKALPQNTSSTVVNATPGKPLVVAHITDTHITSAYNSQKWVTECLHQLQSHPDKPDFILHTGDVIYDSLRADRPKAEKYWKTWAETVKQDCSLPIHVAIGNHDVLGGKMPTSDPINKDPGFGKALVKERLGLERFYYSFDFGNWHFIMLDAIYPLVENDTNTWIAKLGEEQLHWLKTDLASVPKDKNVVVGSHVPIAQISHMLRQKPAEDGTYSSSNRNMLTDARQVIDLFRKHPNVKLCLSGHTHVRDRCLLENATYINAGSVCGAQWKVMEQDPKRPGYSMIKLHDDGQFDYTYENYGWKKS